MARAQNAEQVVETTTVKLMGLGTTPVEQVTTTAEQVTTKV